MISIFYFLISSIILEAHIFSSSDNSSILSDNSILDNTSGFFIKDLYIVLGVIPNMLIYLINVCVFIPLFPVSIFDIYLTDIPIFLLNLLELALISIYDF